MSFLNDIYSSDKKKRQKAIGLFSFLEEQKEQNESGYTDEELDSYGLENWQKDEVKKGNEDIFNFEEDDLEDDDYFNEDD